MHIHTMESNISAAVAVGVVGAAGYTGQEVLRLLAHHPGADLRFATSDSEAGEDAGVSGLTLTPAADAPLQEVDVVFLCVPHGAAVPWVERARSAGARVVDLTADHRPGSGREEASGAVYGLPELHGDAVARADLVANPGCYPTGVQLALRPLLDAGLVASDDTVVVNAASGVTGAGRTPKRSLLFAEVAGDYRAYGLGNEHRHLKEIRVGLPGLPILFQPHLLPVARGILETIYLPVPPGVGPDQVRAAWSERYAEARALRVWSRGVPALTDVVGTDRLDLGVVANAGLPGHLTVVAALDNLGKGAAGQAVQNFNLMTGQPSDRGIRC